VDAEGKREASFAPFMTPRLKGRCGVCLAAELLAAPGDTKRISPLYRRRGAVDMEKSPVACPSLGLAVEQVHELLDFYHAVQHLSQVVALRKDWSAKARARWRTQQRRFLLQARWSRSLRPYRRSVEAATARRSRAAELLHQEPEPHGVCHAHRHEASYRERSDESTVRRVVNLRLKGPSLFWCSCQCRGHTPVAVVLQSGRWNMLKRMATSPLALLEA